MLASKGTAAMVPTFTVEPFDGVGAQLCPLQHRHGYAAGIHHGLPTGDITQPRSSPDHHTDTTLEPRLGGVVIGVRAANRP